MFDVYSPDDLREISDDPRDMPDVVFRDEDRPVPLDDDYRDGDAG